MAKRETLTARAERLSAENLRLSQDVQRLRQIVRDLENPPPLPGPPEMNLKIMEEAVGVLLTGMAVDRKDPNFVDTPRRVAKMYAEMLTPPENTWTTFPGGTYDEIILLRGHRTVGFCPHHILPFTMRCYVAYIPQKQVLGLSKLARVCEQFLTRPIMQEEVTRLICDELWTRLEPKAAGVIIAGEHSCMSLRGVESEGDAVTSAMRGAFLLNPAARQELMTLIGRP